MQLLGSAIVEFDGEVVRSKQGEATLTLGGKVGNTVMGPNKVSGHYFTNEPGRLEVTLSLGKGESATKYQGRSGTAVFRTDTGQVYTVTSAVVVETPSLKASSGGDINLVLEGNAAREKV